MIERYALIFPWIVFVVVWLVAAPFTKKTVRREPLTSRWPALLAIVLAIVLLNAHSVTALAPWIWSRVIPSTPVTRAIAYACEYAGIAFAIWARFTLGSLWSGRITLKENHRLVQSGPFAITRHPIYTGILAAGLGIAIFLGSLHGLLAFLILFAAFAMKIDREEALMRETFGDEHRAYAQRVRKLVPYVW